MDYISAPHWRTATGKLVPIHRMSDEYITNCLNLIARRRAQFREMDELYAIQPRPELVDMLIHFEDALTNEQGFRMGEARRRKVL